MSNHGRMSKVRRAKTRSNFRRKPIERTHQPAPLGEWRLGALTHDQSERWLGARCKSPLRESIRVTRPCQRGAASGSSSFGSGDGRDARPRRSDSGLLDRIPEQILGGPPGRVDPDDAPPPRGMDVHERRHAANPSGSWRDETRVSRRVGRMPSVERPMRGRVPRPMYRGGRWRVEDHVAVGSASGGSLRTSSMIGVAKRACCEVDVGKQVTGSGHVDRASAAPGRVPVAVGILNQAPEPTAAPAPTPPDPSIAPTPDSSPSPVPTA